MPENEVRLARYRDLHRIIDIAKETFSGMKKWAKEWVKVNQQAKPRMLYFILPNMEGRIYDPKGYILWNEKGGFRDEAVIELEQLAVKKRFQGQGVELELILQSFHLLEKYFKDRGSFIKKVLVTINTSNEDQRVYIKAFEQLGFVVSQKLVILDLYEGDELIMVFKRAN